MKTSLIAPLLFFICTQASQAVVTLTAIEDNNVFRGASSTNQTNGATFTLKESSVGQGNARMGFIKFNLAGVSTSHGTNAFFTTTLAATSAGTGSFNLQLYALNAGAPGFDWIEATILGMPSTPGITYANRPAAIGSGNLIDPAAATRVGDTLTVGPSTAAGTQFTFSVPDWDTYRQADDTMTLIFIVSSQTDGNPSLTFVSKDAMNANGPTLFIPEPSSCLLVAIGGIALISKRRRIAA